MTTTVNQFVLGPIKNNTYLLADLDSGKAAVIDPSAPSKELFNKLQTDGLFLEAILITHAHFDHIGGVKWLKKQFDHTITVALHQEDLDLWRQGGGSKDFGFDLDTSEPPNQILKDNDSIQIGSQKMIALHTPGHTPGHVTFYLPAEQLAFCGDLIFYHGVGRTDLSHSDESKLLESIRDKIFSLPPQTLLYPGHGQKTSVAEEKENNPFL